MNHLRRCSLTYIKSVHHIQLDGRNTRAVINACLFAFPQIWASVFIRKNDASLLMLNDVHTTVCK